MTGHLSHAELIARFCELAWDRGLYVHWCGDGRRCEGPGLPDLLIAGPGGVLFREVKSASAPQLSGDQKAWRRMLRLSDQEYRVWTQADLDDGAAAAELGALATSGA